MSDFSQPVCDECFAGRYPDKFPIALRHPDRETCCLCGCQTVSGIYIRIDPRSVPHPRLKETR